MSDPSVSQASIDELRSTFLNELTTKAADCVHPKDLERVKNDDFWLQRFIMHNKNDIKKSCEMLWASVTWRNENNVNDLKDLDMNILCSGIFFPLDADIDGCKLLVFKCSKHTKGSVPMEAIKKCINYWFERIEREVNGKQITMFFDMENCGLSNMDLEIIKYFINLFKEYYPYFLNYILIFEMSWVLSAGFKLVKAMLPPEGVAKIKFVSKKDIKTLVPLEKALKCWGGENDYVFSYVPESLPENTNSLPINNNNRKVHFMDGSMSEISANSGDKENNVSDGDFLKVSPASFITFVKDGKENCSTLELQNVDPIQYLSYKLKTTSPEKFSVKPSTGCLAPGESQTVVVTLLQGYQLGGLSKDKFLVMSISLEPSEASSLDISEFWKNTSGRKIHQHRLKCIQTNETGKNENSFSNHALQEDDSSFKKLQMSINKLSAHQAELHKAIKTTQYYQTATVFLILLLGITFAYVLKTNLKEIIPSHSYCREDNIP